MSGSGPINNKDQLAPGFALARPTPTRAPDPSATPKSPSDQLRLGSKASTAVTVSPDGLWPEEYELVKAGFLPPNYAKLEAARVNDELPPAKKQALYRQGLTKGPFTADYGDPTTLLAGARMMRENPQLAQLFKDLRKGDILLIAPSHDPSGVSKLTQGAFTHAMICVTTDPYPQFIEAIGITRTAGDTTANQVRRTTIYSQLSPDRGYAIMRPAALNLTGTDPARVDKAVAYAEAQLGKPYNYAFGQRNDKGAAPGKPGEAPSAFYCSELVYQAYAQGAGLELPYGKSGVRDRVVVQLDDLIDALGPKDKLALKTQVSNFMATGPSKAQWATFLANEVLPNCQLTAKLGTTPAKRQALADELLSLLDHRKLSLADSARLCWNFSSLLSPSTFRFTAMLVKAYWSIREDRTDDTGIGGDPSMRYLDQHSVAAGQVLGDFISPSDLIDAAGVPHRTYNANPAALLHDHLRADGMQAGFGVED